MTWLDFRSLKHLKTFLLTMHYTAHSKYFWLIVCLLPWAILSAHAQKPQKKTHITVPAIYKVDTDQDKVPDVRDQCPGTPLGVKVNEFGCPPDTDGDGVFDYEDECVTVPGPAKNKGCPWGDRDGDGITDDIDRCPDVPGTKQYYGCPPPDRDKDGVIDPQDRCPDTPGVIENQGCPEIVTKQEREILEKASKVEFEFGKWTILPKWYPVLNEVAKIMFKYPDAYLLLEGHTDAIGTEEDNQILSENRAAAVREYLINQGVEPFRIESVGYGESQPIDTNDTPEGRQRNRRVKMTIYYRKN
jgi:outer membrane protein OmpA-like peptidoglycan-associated protein